MNFLHREVQNLVRDIVYGNTEIFCVTFWNGSMAARNAIVEFNDKSFAATKVFAVVGAPPQGDSA